MYHSRREEITYSGKVLIVEYLTISVSGYELKNKGIPAKYKKKKDLDKITLDFIWDGKVYKLKREHGNGKLG